MKRILPLAAVILALLLAACGNKQPADGVYTAEADDAYVAAYGYGWRDTLTVAIENGAVVSGEYDAYDTDKNRKSTPGNYPEMDPPPSEWMPQLSAELAGTAAPEEIDTVAGATIASNNIRQLFQAILKDGKPGETIQVSLDPPA